jgi:hypothetical protein
MATKEAFFDKVENELHIKSAFNEKANIEYRKLAGKWNGKAWVVDAAFEEEVKAAMVKVFGTFDTRKEKTVDVILTAKANLYEAQKGFSIGARELFYATGRDSGAKTCAGVALVEGKIFSAGSAKNWTTEASKGTKIKVIGLYEQALNFVDNEEWSVEIIKKEDDSNDALLKEREALLARLAEIDSQLNLTTEVKVVAKKVVKNGAGVMKKAWVIVKEMIKNFGGKSHDYLSKALKISWSEASFA